MTKNAHVGHIISVALTTVIAILTPALLPGGALAHYSWAPLALAAAVYLARVATSLGGSPPTAAAVLAVAGSFLLRALGAVAILVLLSLAGCKSVLGPTPPPNTPGFVNCSDAALHAAALNILPSVETALASPSYEQALATIVASVGGPLALSEVECAVAWVASNAALQESATGDPLEATKAANARAWLAAHPVTF